MFFLFVSGCNLQYLADTPTLFSVVVGRPITRPFLSILFYFLRAFIIEATPFVAPLPFRGAQVLPGAVGFL